MDHSIIALVLNTLKPALDQTTLDQLRSLSIDQWRALIDLAQAQNVAELLYHALRSNSIESSAPIEIQQTLKEIYQRNTIQNLRNLKNLNELASLLQNNHIPVLVLKGAYLAYTVYENLALRELADLDLLLPQADLMRAQQLVESLGYRSLQPYDQVDFTFWHQMPGLKRADSALVELHWTIMPPPSTYSVAAPIDPVELWARAVPVKIGAADVLSLCAEDMLLHVCAHLSYHHRFEFGLRPICDIARIIRYGQNNLDWPQVIDRAKRWQWERGIYLALRLAKELIGADIGEETLKQLQPIGFDEQIVTAARAQIFTDRKLALEVSPKLSRFRFSGRFIDKVREVWRSIFLPKSELANIYGVPINSRRLPFYYLVRVKDLLMRYGKMIFHLWGKDQTLSPIAQRKSILVNWLSGK